MFFHNKTNINKVGYVQSPEVKRPNLSLPACAHVHRHPLERSTQTTNCSKPSLISAFYAHLVFSSLAADWGRNPFQDLSHAVYKVLQADQLAYLRSMPARHANRDRTRSSPPLCSLLPSVLSDLLTLNLDSAIASDSSLQCHLKRPSVVGAHASSVILIMAIQK